MTNRVNRALVEDGLVFESRTMVLAVTATTTATVTAADTATG